VETALGGVADFEALEVGVVDFDALEVGAPDLGALDFGELGGCIVDTGALAAATGFVGGLVIGFVMIRAGVSATIVGGVALGCAGTLALTDGAVIGAAVALAGALAGTALGCEATAVAAFWPAQRLVPYASIWFRSSTSATVAERRASASIEQPSGMSRSSNASRAAPSAAVPRSLPMLCSRT
jgi:hypothetical protein